MHLFRYSLWNVYFVLIVPYRKIIERIYMIKRANEKVGVAAIQQEFKIFLRFLSDK